MLKLWSQCCAEKAMTSNNTSPDAYVETRSKDNHHDDLKDQISLEELPTEILILILERLDKVSLFYCFFVNKRLRSVVVNIANRDKTNMMWYFLYRQYQMEGFCQQNANFKCLFPFQELIESSLNWIYKCSTSLSDSVPVTDAVQMTVYRDNIIVVTTKGVKYFDKETFKIKKTIKLDKCYHFIENDYMVARSIKYDNGKGYKLQLIGKSCFDDCQWESQITTSGIYLNRLSEIETEAVAVRVFRIEENCCFVILNSKNTLKSYDWKYMETPKEWRKRFLCLYYGGMDEIVSMDIGRKQIYLLTRKGGLFCYQRETDGVIAKVYTFSGLRQCRFVQLVHRSNLVVSVPDEYPCRIMRIRQSGLPILYRLELPKLTCVTEHGIVLFLGYSDGKVQIMRPTNCSRENMVKHFIDLAVFRKEPPAPVVSIVVYVDDGKQSLFVATTSCVYRFTPTFPDEKKIWDKENIVSFVYVPRVDLISI